MITKARLIQAGITVVVIAALMRVPKVKAVVLNEGS